MTEALILEEYECSRRNARARCEAVNALRHLMMDEVKFNVADDAVYMAVYVSIMSSIESRYPHLSWEVKRQVAKKRRRQERKAHAQRQEIVHF